MAWQAVYRPSQPLKQKLVSGLSRGYEMQRLVEREEQVSATLKPGLGMVNEQVHGNHACADDGAGKGSAGSAENGAGDCSRTHRAAVFNAVFLQMRARRNSRLRRLRAIPSRARRKAAHTCWKREPSGRITVCGRRCMDPCPAKWPVETSVTDSVDLRSGRNEDLAVLNHVGGNARTEFFAGLACGRREARQQTDANDGAVAQFTGSQRRRMHDVAVGIVHFGALIQTGREVASGATTTMPPSVPSAMPGSAEFAMNGGGLRLRGGLRFSGSGGCAGGGCRRSTAR